MKLSIITCCKNDVNELVETLDSTTRIRKHKNCEQVVIDGSTKENQKKVKLICKNKSVKYIYRKPKGISDAFNFGLVNTTGEWIWYLNSGDKVLGSFDLNNLIWMLENSTAEALIFQIVDEKYGRSLPTPLKKLWPPLINWVNHPSTLTKRVAIDTCGGFDKQFKIAMDGDLWFRFFDRGFSADLVSIPLTFYKGGGISSNLKLASGEVLRVYWKNKGLLLKSVFEHCLRLGKSVVIYLVNTIGPRT